jgi:hypothetical protein
MRIVGTPATSATRAAMDDCLPATPEVEGCMYLLGAMPVQLGELETNCPLPDGSTAPSCVPIEIGPQAMYATSLSMDASVGITINTDTGTSVMRIREPAGGGPVKAFIVDGGGTPKMIVALDLYMDAPDMSIPLSSHDLQSKPLADTRGAGDVPARRADRDRGLEHRRCPGQRLDRCATRHRRHRRDDLAARRDEAAAAIAPAARGRAMKRALLACCCLAIAPAVADAGCAKKKPAKAQKQPRPTRTGAGTGAGTDRLARSGRGRTAARHRRRRSRSHGSHRSAPS